MNAIGKSYMLEKLSIVYRTASTDFLEANFMTWPRARQASIIKKTCFSSSLLPHHVR